MLPHEIRAALVLARIKPQDIAWKFRKSATLVHLVINGVRFNPQIREEISNAIGKPIAEIWPDQQDQQSAA